MAALHLSTAATSCAFRCCCSAAQSRHDPNAALRVDACHLLHAAAILAAIREWLLVQSRQLMNAAAKRLARMRHSALLMTCKGKRVATHFQSPL